MRTMIGRWFPSFLTPSPTPVQEPTGLSPPSVDVMTETIMGDLSINFDKLSALPQAELITSFIKRRVIDPGFQKYYRLQYFKEQRDFSLVCASLKTEKW